MTHFTEKDAQLCYTITKPKSLDKFKGAVQNLTDVNLVILPSTNVDGEHVETEKMVDSIQSIKNNLITNSTLIIVGEIVDLVRTHSVVNHDLNFHHWIIIQRNQSRKKNHQESIPQTHFGALVYTTYERSLKHIKTRNHYTYCPACERTTKDYGGKKHTYHQSGTLISDVWQDLECDLAENLDELFGRFADLFAIDEYSNMQIIDLRLYLKVVDNDIQPSNKIKVNAVSEKFSNQIIHGDCLEELDKIADDSVDFVFTDPPYNLGKKYRSYNDDLEIEKYFTWCDEWLTELIRVLKPGRTLAVLNIPLWSIRHFQHLTKIATFQNWIAWNALSYPVRFIMPAHYTILCFTKGRSRKLPGLTGDSGKTKSAFTPSQFDSLQPLADKFCVRASCIKKRNKAGISDRSELTDIWSDIHRLKHNSRRVDHPTQLPPHLIYRLLSIFTKEGEYVLDCFNGSGTTTLAAHQLNRKYIGIEQSEKYVEMARDRHKEIEAGIDPFRKADREPKAKNSPVARMPKQQYKVPKKVLQLDVRRIAKEIGTMPRREDVEEHSEYPIEYFDNYFASWGEVCAAVRNKGMTETKDDDSPKQLKLF